MSEIDHPVATDTNEPTAKFDRSELVQGWNAYTDRTPEVVPVLKYSGRTDMGRVRENNEDKFDFYDPEEPAILAARGSLFAVADGMGGAQAGQIASEMLLKQLINSYYDDPFSEVENALRNAIVQANDQIYSLAQMIPERQGMGTTLVTTIFLEDKVLVAHVGDSRVYRIRNGECERITVDHSWVEEQTRMGLMTRDQAELSPFKNIITRSVGAMQYVDPELSMHAAVPGDTWVLCSDGLTGYVEDVEITDIVTTHSASEATRQLILLANARGGRDNITVFVISIRGLVNYNKDTDPLQTGSEPESVPVSDEGSRSVFGKLFRK